MGPPNWAMFSSFVKTERHSFMKGTPQSRWKSGFVSSIALQLTRSPESLFDCFPIIGGRSQPRRWERHVFCRMPCNDRILAIQTRQSDLPLAAPND